MAINESTILNLINKLKGTKNPKAPIGVSAGDVEMTPPELDFPELDAEQALLGNPPDAEPDLPSQNPFRMAQTLPEDLQDEDITVEGKFAQPQQELPSLEDLDVEDAKLSNAIANKVSPVRTMKETNEISKNLEEKLALAKKGVAGAAGLGAGALALDALAGGGKIAGAGNAASAGFDVFSKFLGANPAAIPVSYIAGRSAKELYDEYNSGGPIKTAVDSYIDRFNGSPSITQAVNAPEIASRVGETVGSNVIPEAGTNALGSIGKLLTGGIRGLAGGAKNVLNVTDSALNETRSALAPLADSPTARLLGAIAGSSDKGIEAGALSKVLTGIDVTRPQQSVLSGNSDMQVIIDEGDRAYHEVQLKPREQWTQNDIKHMTEWPGAREKLGKAIASTAGGVDWSKIPSTTQKSVTDLTQGYATLDSSERDINWAIKNKDLSTFIPAINNAISANSVLLQQGVITDPEAGRLLQSVMTQAQALQADGTPQEISRFFNSETWKSALNTIAVMKNSAIARGDTVQKQFPELVPVFERVGFPTLSSVQQTTENGKESTLLNAKNVMTKEVRDALAIAEQAKTQGLQTKRDIEAAREAAIVLKNSGSGALELLGEGLDAIVGKGPVKKEGKKDDKKIPSAKTQPKKPARRKL
jgi:hypothetical protein